MTAEIAIVNRSAIAVAADSAVTVGRDKVHVSANKIFSISEASPIGCMIYGTADFANIPWETIIKIFRNEHSHKTFLTVNECRLNFYSFLSGPRFITDKTTTTSFVLFVVSLIEPLKDKLSNIPPRERTHHFEKIIQSGTNQFINHPKSINCNLPSEKDFLSTSKQNIRTITNEVFSEINYRYPTKLDKLLTSMIYAAFSSEYVSNYQTGIVFFGFGKDELLPVLTRDELDGAPFGTLRIKEDSESNDNDENLPATIYPFADIEIMTSFMEGATKNMQAMFRSILYNTNSEIARRVIEENFSLSNEDLTLIHSMNRKTIENIVDEAMAALDQQIHERSVGPVMRAVASLPKEEMARLAEALVEVTALKKKVSPTVESVGGPIDVCVVTKGDGFIWIKRKHYFDLNKNLQYMSYRNLNPLLPKAAS